MIKKQINVMEDGRVVKVHLMDTDTGRVATGTAKAHPDDADFANDLTGIQIAQIRAAETLFMRNHKEYADLATKERKNLEILRAKIDSYEAASVAFLEESINAKKAHKELIDSKEDLYQKIRAKRSGESGQEHDSILKELGDLTANLSPETKLEYAKQIMEGSKDGAK